MMHIRSNTRALILRKHALERAWLALVAAIAMLAFTFLITLFTGHLKDAFPSLLMARLTDPESWKARAFVGCCILGLCVLRKPGPWVRLTRLRHLPHFIPLWWVALTAGFVWAAAMFAVPGMMSLMGLPLWIRTVSQGSGWVLFYIPGLAALGHLLFWCHWSLCSIARTATEPDSSMLSEQPEACDDPDIMEKKPLLLRESEAFLAWVRSDQPVRSMQDDRLGTRLMAMRIARLLRTPKLTTHAVVGELGSGKTTVGVFLPEVLDAGKGGPRFRVIQIGLWPFLSPDAAISGILNRILDALDTEVGVGHLRMIPKQYLEILGAFPGFWQGLARSLQGNESDPAKLLKVIDDVATMLNIRLVVWIDDLERFAGYGGPGGQDQWQDLERLSPIRALLHALGEQVSTTVIVATTSLTTGFDWNKIARHIHEMPLLAPEYSGQILEAFRSECLQGFIHPDEAKPLTQDALARSWIDPSPGSLQNEFGKATVKGTYQEQREILDGNLGFMSIQQAMSLICRTPRSLKQALRRVEELWSPARLRGEIQFDQLLAICLLREGCPLGFAVLRDHWSRIQSSERQGDHRFFMAQRTMEEVLKQAGASKEARHAGRPGDGLAAIISGLSTNQDRPAVHFLATLRQVGLDQVAEKSVLQVAEFLLSDPEKAGPQGFKSSVARGDCYWRLFIDEVALPAEARDQLLMKQVLQASTEGLADLVAAEASGLMLLDFEAALKPNWNGVMPAIVRRHAMATEWGMQRWHDSYRWPKTLVKILRQVYFDKRMGWDFSAEFELSFHLALELNPDLAVQLEYLFLDQSRPIDWFLDGATKGSMSSRMRDLVRDHVASRTYDGLIKLSIPFGLKQLCFGLDDRHEANNPDLAEIPDWCTPLFLDLLAKAEADKEVRLRMIPQLAHVLVGGTPYTFRADLAESLLGGTDRLFALVIAGEEPNIDIDPVMGILFREARLPVTRTQEFSIAAAIE